MNPRTLIVVALAGVCGLSAMFLVQALRKPQDQPVIPKGGVVYAIAEIKPGETITAEMVELRQMPLSEIPEDAIREVEKAVDRAAMAQLDPGDMLRDKKLADKGAGRGLAAMVRPGMRAFTIQTPSFSSSMAGFLLPGNRVDVLLTVNSDGGMQDETGGGATTTLLQNVEILAVHTSVSTPTANKMNPDEARSVTLLVTPDEVELLDLGQNKGTLHLSLRNLKEPMGEKSKPVTMADLQIPRLKPDRARGRDDVEKPVPPPPVPLPPPPPAFEEFKLTIRTLRGTAAGADVLTVVVPTAPGRASTPAQSVAASPTSGNLVSP
ncbi:Flp pilus assembly protein CpaB [Tundrisphaera lichenicola]|uniref:Flp pilus assembly protein CpaB n=1 Tax=Tundrisphaera lichenicola TaxID=2029860 RepID=UPI003EC0799E